MSKFVYSFEILFVISLVSVNIKCVPVQEPVDQLQSKNEPLNKYTETIAEIHPESVRNERSPKLILDLLSLKYHHHHPHFHHGSYVGGYGGGYDGNNGFSGTGGNYFGGYGGNLGSQSNAQSYSSSFNTPFGSFSASQSAASSSSNGGGGLFKLK
ncbi:hypothetical protein PGB90_010095 [Kerria lacca]